jgi:hypothetical protein
MEYSPNEKEYPLDEKEYYLIGEEYSPNEKEYDKKNFCCLEKRTFLFFTDLDAC